jgi:hypothetical protein
MQFVGYFIHYFIANLGTKGLIYPLILHEINTKQYIDDEYTLTDQITHNDARYRKHKMALITNVHSARQYSGELGELTSHQ